MFSEILWWGFETEFLAAGGVSYPAPAKNSVSKPHHYWHDRQVWFWYLIGVDITATLTDTARIDHFRRLGRDSLYNNIVWD